MSLILQLSGTSYSVSKRRRRIIRRQDIDGDRGAGEKKARKTKAEVVG